VNFGVVLKISKVNKLLSTYYQLKSYLRTTMDQTRLSDLGLLYRLKDKEVNKNAVIDEFCADNKRRLNLK